MRNAILALLAGTMLLALSCGGGSTTPKVYDLAGLEGTWDYTITWNGVISGPGGSIPHSDTVTGYWIIGRNSVIDQDGDPWVWSFDGSTLTLNYGENGTFQDPTCGDVYYTEADHATIALTSGATVGNVTGTLTITFTTDLCGDMSGTLPLTGNMTKR